MNLSTFVIISINAICIATTLAIMQSIGYNILSWQSLCITVIIGCVAIANFYDGINEMDREIS